MQELLEAAGVNQVDHAQTGSCCFVAIRRSDAPLRGADFIFAFEKLALFIQFTVIRKHQVGRLADEKIAVDMHAQLSEAIDLLDQTDRIDHHAVADHADFAFAQDPRRNQVQHIFLLADENGVTSIVSSLGAHDDVRIVGEDINDLAFTFIAPLGAYQDCIGHKLFAPRQ